MAERTVQLVLQYDGAAFSGWQRQPSQRTVQGVVEEALERLCAAPIAALGSGRTDSGVHARGQAVGVRVPDRWDVAKLRRALNSILPQDIWVSNTFFFYVNPTRSFTYCYDLDQKGGKDGRHTSQPGKSSRLWQAGNHESETCNQPERCNGQQNGLQTVME